MIDVVTLRADNYSPDGKRISISIVTNDSTEMKFSVPVACLHELIADLRKLQSPRDSVSPTPSNQTAVTSRAAEDLNRVNVTVPKKWMLGSGLPNHPVVIMVFDPQTKAQAGYALNVTAAREMAAGLVKQADTVTEHEKSKRKPN